jgi:sterol desaturase/sphingolipid hydroxylase (fatty acid hydroxylase superfamily)
MLSVLSGAAVAFALLAAVFWPLERLFSARAGQPWIRPAWWTDVLFFFGQYLVWSGVALFVLGRVRFATELVMPGVVRAVFAAQPMWLQALEVVALGDLAVYGFHRASHAVPGLWRFHAVHHSAEHLDWLAAHREHPVDGILTQLSVNLPAILLGFSLAQVAWLIALRGMWAIFIHSNVRLPLGPLRVLLGAPELHHWHHLATERARNFANLAPWTDLLFGTYHLPTGTEDWPLGLTQPFPRSYLGMLLAPFRRGEGASAPPAPGRRWR